MDDTNLLKYYCDDFACMVYVYGPVCVCVCVCVCACVCACVCVCVCVCVYFMFVKVGILQVLVRALEMYILDLRENEEEGNILYIIYIIYVCM